MDNFKGFYFKWFVLKDGAVEQYERFILDEDMENAYKTWIFAKDDDESALLEFAIDYVLIDNVPYRNDCLHLTPYKKLKDSWSKK